jgi:ferredoxin
MSKNDHPNDMANRARHHFLQRLAMGVTLAAAPGVLLYAAAGRFPGERKADQPVNDSVRRGMLVDKHICIGCRYCMMACPYGARSFIAYDAKGHTPYNPSVKGTVEACTLCIVRMDREHIDGMNGAAACAAACEQEEDTAP